MSQLRVVKYPDPVLRKRAARVERVTPEMRDFLSRMADAMYADHGVGLAAPQVGISLQVVVIDAGDGLLELINPQIIARAGEQTALEGCLSLPGLYGEVTRAQRVTVTALDASGKKITLTGEDLLARAFQHEIDHLNGVLFIERAAPDSFCRLTGEKDEDGDDITRPVSLDEALHAFEAQEPARARA